MSDELIEQRRRKLAAPSPEHRAVGPHDVAEVERQQPVERLLPEHIRPRMQLHPA